MAAVRVKLSIMMFLEFAIWGAWLPLVYKHLTDLGFSSDEKGWIMNAFPIAAIIAMFFGNQFADRNFAAEKFTAFSHLVGGLAILALAWVDQIHASLAPDYISKFAIFLTLMLIHCVFYVPTISITNSIAFTHLKDAQREFSLVRLWGTIGWIVVGVPFIFILLDWSRVPAFGSVSFVDWFGALLSDQNAKTGTDLHHGRSFIFVVAGGCSLVLAAFCLSLPPTPPRHADSAQPGVEKSAWLEAVKLLRYPFILILFLVTFVDSAVHAGYFLLADSYLQSIGVPANWVMPVMSIGQFAEIGTMALLGYCLKWLGWRNIMVLGILGHTARFTLFAFVPDPWVATAVNLLHGICYAFFFATVYIFVDEYFPKDVRSSAQGLFNFMILGLGQLVGNFLWPYLEEHFKKGQVVDYRDLFLIPAGAALAAAAFLFLFFWPPTKAAELTS
jgi:nucleoside transporter